MIPGKALESSRISDIIRILTSKKNAFCKGLPVYYDPCYRRNLYKGKPPVQEAM